MTNREKVAKWLQEFDARADLPNGKTFDEEADSLLAMLKSNGWAKLSENQELPPNPDIPVPTAASRPVHRPLSEYGEGYLAAQNAMLAANFRRIEEGK